MHEADTRSKWRLPTSLFFSGKTWEIKTDYRDILELIEIVSNPDLFLPDATEEEKGYVLAMSILDNLFFEEVPEHLWKDAIEQANWFISCGQEENSNKKTRKLMDWEQDAHILIPAINGVAKTDVRGLPYLHWWTFVSYYMDIGESYFSTIIGIRQKKMNGKKLEKHEKEFYNAHREEIDLKKRETTAEKEEKANILKWL